MPFDTWPGCDSGKHFKVLETGVWVLACGNSGGAKAEPSETGCALLVAGFGTLCSGKGNQCFGQPELWGPERWCGGTSSAHSRLRRGAGGLERKMELESFVFPLLGFGALLHLSQRRDEEPIQGASMISSLSLSLSG